MTMIRLPLKARAGASGLWIEDGAGVTLCDFNPLLGDQAALPLLAARMAAAPELLAALTEALLVSGSDDDATASRPWHDKARSAIAKAEGREA